MLKNTAINFELFSINLMMKLMMVKLLNILNKVKKSHTAVFNSYESWIVSFYWHYFSQFYVNTEAHNCSTMAAGSGEERKKSN